MGPEGRDPVVYREKSEVNGNWGYICYGSGLRAVAEGLFPICGRKSMDIITTIGEACTTTEKGACCAHFLVPSFRTNT